MIVADCDVISSWVGPDRGGSRGREHPLLMIKMAGSFCSLFACGVMKVWCNHYTTPSLHHMQINFSEGVIRYDGIMTGWAGWGPWFSGCLRC